MRSHLIAMERLVLVEKNRLQPSNAALKIPIFMFGLCKGLDISELVSPQRDRLAVVNSSGAAMPPP